VNVTRWRWYTNQVPSRPPAASRATSTRWRNYNCTARLLRPLAAPGRGGGNTGSHWRNWASWFLRKTQVNWYTLRHLPLLHHRKRWRRNQQNAA
jgi:hypothetical protein